jgi:hypothetical protein
VQAAGCGGTEALSKSMKKIIFCMFGVRYSQGRETRGRAGCARHGLPVCEAASDFWCENHIRGIDCRWVSPVCTALHSEMMWTPIELRVLQKNRGILYAHAVPGGVCDCCLPYGRFDDKTHEIGTLGIHPVARGHKARFCPFLI